MTALALVLLLAQDTRSIPLPGSTQPLVFRSIPAGSFTMGSPDTEAGRDRDEGPAHPVTISRPFFLAIHEVTQAQWTALMGHNPSVFQQRHPEGGDPALRPVDSVSFDDVQRFLARLNALDRGRFRLPTEAEWEYAARAGSTTRFSFGDATNLNEVHRYAWTNSRSYATTHPVGSKPANAWGLHDMHGNVWEWCADWYAPYPPAPQTDPRGPASGSERVFRGGSYFDFPIALRSANRHRHGPQRGYTAIGFRLAADSLEGTEPANLTRLPGGVTLAFVRIPKGTFTIGSPTDEAGRANDESPRPTVTISRDFDLGKFEVTQAQWRAVMGANPSVFQDPASTPDHPVEMVSWLDVQEFLAKLNALRLGRFRLPTEAEWEYAARAGTSTRFPWGDDPEYRTLAQHAWFNSRSEGRTHPAGQKLANPWGLYDMFGNVWEWCSDRFGPYPAADQRDPAGAATGEPRVIRGGSWFNEPEALRPANRHRHPADSRQTNLGFRLVREID